MKYIVCSLASSASLALLSIVIFFPDTTKDEFQSSFLSIFSLILPICLVVWHFLIAKENDDFRFKLSQREYALSQREAQHNDSVQQAENQLRAKEESIIEKRKENNQLFIKQQEEIKKIESQALAAAPWLAEMFADYRCAVDSNRAYYLDTKKNPAHKAANLIRESMDEKRSAIKELKLLQYQMNIYETVAPWLEDFKEVDSETIRACIQSDPSGNAETDFDTVKRWLSKAEYDSLSTVERYQLALDRYKQSRKTKWEIGRDFERYVGFLYESGGSKVEYFGANKGLEDLGRDLVVHCTTADGIKQTAIVQCKYWNDHRTIHEKHIFQLYGTSVLYRIEHKTEDVRMAFVTTAPLSDTAQKAAQMLGISIVDIAFEKDYPCIKCNINESTGQRIYHLPFDQQYDRVRINPAIGELYVHTVAQAEAYGFRRAMRWKGTSE